MKATIKIPKGWRRLRMFEVLLSGDRWLRASDCTWQLRTENQGGRYEAGEWPHIRRIKRKDAK